MQSVVRAERKPRPPDMWLSCVRQVPYYNDTNFLLGANALQAPYLPFGGATLAREPKTISPDLPLHKKTSNEILPSPDVLGKGFFSPHLSCPSFTAPQTRGTQCRDVRLGSLMVPSSACHTALACPTT